MLPRKCISYGKSRLLCLRGSLARRLSPALCCILPPRARATLRSEWRDPTLSSRARHGRESEFGVRSSVYELSATPVLAYSAIARVTWRAPPTSTSGALKRHGRLRGRAESGRHLIAGSCRPLLNMAVAVRISCLAERLRACGRRRRFK